MLRFIKKFFSKNKNSISNTDASFVYANYTEVELVDKTSDDKGTVTECSFRYAFTVKIPTVKFYINAYKGPEEMRIVLFSYVPTQEDIKNFLINQYGGNEINHRYEINIKKDTIKILFDPMSSDDANQLSRGLKKHTRCIDGVVSMPVDAGDLIDKVDVFCEEHGLFSHLVMFELSKVYVFR